MTLHITKSLTLGPYLLEVINTYVGIQANRKEGDSILRKEKKLLSKAAFRQYRTSVRKLHEKEKFK